MRDPSSLPGPLAARILHIRPELMVIDKPAGLPLDPGRAGGPSLEDWLPLLQLGKRHLPHPAHRLDRDTAGCLVLGRTKPALAALNALFAARTVRKTYWAVTAGRPNGTSGTIDAPLRKTSTREAGWRMEPHPDGQPARTAWRLLGTAGGPECDLAWLELHPETGRTHQLRVHLAALGCPILGDPLYGTRPHPAGLHLLARAIALPAGPVTGAPLACEAPVPPAMAPGFARCGAPVPSLVTKV